jgi:hypothetical protein
MVDCTIDMPGDRTWRPRAGCQGLATGETAIGWLNASGRQTRCRNLARFLACRRYPHRRNQSDLQF